jgi:hypothetical protein
MLLYKTPQLQFRSTKREEYVRETYTYNPTEKLACWSSGMNRIPGRVLQAGCEARGRAACCTYSTSVRNGLTSLKYTTTEEKSSVF